MTDAKPALLVFRSNHFDHLWRRCWLERFQHGGQAFASYGDIEQWYIDDNLDRCRDVPGYAFELESAICLREYLRRRPERAGELRALAQAGRFAVTAAGETICDANMLLGETMVRNWLVGQRYVQAVLGTTSPLCVRNDAFGNSAQLPQILQGFGVRWCTGISYSPALGRYWRGLDGSTVCLAALPIALHVSSNRKYAPCPQCAGAGCAACGQRGIDATRFAVVLPDALPATGEQHGKPAALGGDGPVGLDVEHIRGGQVPLFAEFNAAMISCGPEEMLPEPAPALADWMQRLRRHADARFALRHDQQAWLQPLIDRCDAPTPAELHPEVEMNPNNTGCYTTRIRTKQQVRAQEHRLLRLESLAALSGAADAAAIEPCWQTVLYGVFHDAITGTSVDPAVDELHRFLDANHQRLNALEATVRGKLPASAGDAVTVINAAGVDVVGEATLRLDADAELLGADGAPLPVSARRELPGGGVELTVVAAAPALGAVTLRRAPSRRRAERELPKPRIENERYVVTANASGVLEVFDRRLGKPVLTNQRSPLGVGELAIERDFGSPWATLHPDRRRAGLGGDKSKLIAARAVEDAQELVYHVTFPWRLQGCAHPLVATVTVRLVSGLERVDWTIDLDWRALNERLRLAFPTGRRGRGIWGIPYGHIERPTYTSQFDEWRWDSSDGAWPAVDWAGLEARDHHVAVLTRGLPSITVEHGPAGEATLFVNAVRSASIPTYLHEPESYTMDAWNGMRDWGQHRFELAIVSGAGGVADGSIAALNEGFQAPLMAVAGAATVPEAPRLVGGAGRITACKPGEGGDGIIVRVAEQRGHAGTARVRIPARFRQVTRCSLAETGDAPIALRDGHVEVPLRAWEIATLRLR